jgi:hypothetical protein
VTFEVSGINQVVADLGTAAATAGAAAHRVVQKGALNVKKDAQRLSDNLAHAPLYPASITYETRVRGFGIEALIGPDKDRPQGALGNLLEYGSANNAPLAHLGPALDLEGARFEKALLDVVDL